LAFIKISKVKINKWLWKTQNGEEEVFIVYWDVNFREFQ